jgi:hypothetical protein
MEVVIFTTTFADYSEGEEVEMVTQQATFYVNLAVARFKKDGGCGCGCNDCNDE